MDAIIDCWSTIGVRGDGSCPQLAEFVHCRNCPVYSAAAKDLLDVALPADYLSRWTVHVAEEEPAAEPDAFSVVIFRVEAEWFALPTSVFAEIVGSRPIHSLPHRGGIVLGLANIGGQLLACISLRDLFALERYQGADRDAGRVTNMRLLVLARDGIRIVCPVDEVVGIRRYHGRELLEVPTTLAKAARTYTLAVLPGLAKPVGVLDEQQVFLSAERSLTSIAI